MTLHDGSVFQGELVEKVPLDHVVIKLATGEVKRFAWSDVTSSEDSVARVTPDGARRGATGDAVISDWPDPHEPPPAPVTGAGSAPVPTQEIDLGLVSAAPQFGSPVGIIGLMTEYKPIPYLGAELDGAYDGPAEVADGDLGWSVAQTLRAGSRMVGGGVGVSEHFGLKTPGVAYMGHADLFIDVDFEGITPLPLTLRFNPGVATMFDPAAHPGACGFYNVLGHGVDDTTGGPPRAPQCLFVYVGVALFYHHRFGGGAS